MHARRFGSLPFWTSYTALAAFAVGVGRGGGWSFGPVILLFGVLPVIDAFAEPNRSTDETPKRTLYDLPLFVWPVAASVATAAGLSVVTRDDAPALTILGTVLSLGILNGSIGINVAHELMHRRGALEGGLAEFLMSLVLYPHFCIEHIAGHHRRVATPEDPATARYGENVFAFMRRSVVGGLHSAWRLEGERAAKRSLRGWRDRRVRQPVVIATILLAVFASVGIGGVLAFVAQSGVAVVLLESINYVEHYGLRRRGGASGGFEPVGAAHAWNSPHRLSNWYLFNLARHSDHHILAGRPYEKLQSRDESPQLPAGYSTMLLVAWCPPIWFRVMNPLAERWATGTATTASPGAP